MSAASFDEFSGLSSPNNAYYAPSFDTFSFEGPQALKMEETIDFSTQLNSFEQILGPALAEAELSLELPPPPQPVLRAASPLKPERQVSPLSFLDEEEEEEEPFNPKWELELEQLISEFDGEVPLDAKLKEELLRATVKEFNRRTRTIKMDPKTIQFLKLQRKRLKNRQAAIRSRTRKETRVTELTRQVEQLMEEKHQQHLLINKLQHRTELLEKELAKARALLAAPPPPPPPSSA